MAVVRILKPEQEFTIAGESPTVVVNGGSRNARLIFKTLDTKSRNQSDSETNLIQEKTSEAPRRRHRGR